MDATRGPILFRCDGTAEHGWEPFYQCLSLAAALQRRRRGTHFLSYLDPLSLATVINRGNQRIEVGLGREFARRADQSPGTIEGTRFKFKRQQAVRLVTPRHPQRAGLVGGKAEAAVKGRGADQQHGAVAEAAGRRDRMAHEL